MLSVLPNLNKPYRQSIGFLGLNQPQSDAATEDYHTQCTIGVPTTNFWDDDWDDPNQSSEEEVGTISL